MPTTRALASSRPGSGEVVSVGGTGIPTKCVLVTAHDATAGSNANHHGIRGFWASWAPGTARAAIRPPSLAASTRPSPMPGWWPTSDPR